MFQFRPFPTYDYLIHRMLTGDEPAGLPHSEIPGSKLICSSPRLIAACHVFLRLLMPRHSPCTLYSLTSSAQASYPSLPPVGESSLIPLCLLSASNPLRWAFIVFWKRSLSSCFPRLQDTYFCLVTFGSQIKVLELCRLLRGKL